MGLALGWTNFLELGCDMERRPATTWGSRSGWLAEVRTGCDVSAPSCALAQLPLDDRGGR